MAIIQTQDVLDVIQDTIRTFFKRKCDQVCDSLARCAVGRNAYHVHPALTHRDPAELWIPRSSIRRLSPAEAAHGK